MAHRSRAAGPSEGSRLLALWMKEQRVNQAALAKLCDVAEPTIGRWLRGERRPDVDSLAMIETITGVVARAWATPTKKNAA